MKINSINTYFPIYKTLNKRTLGNKVQNDVFVKTEHVSFGKKKKNRADLINDFSKNVKKYYYEVPFDRKEIEKLIQKDVKDVKVKSFEELKSSYPLPVDFMGVYTEEFNYFDELDFVATGQKVLYLKNPEEGEYTRLAYYANCVHEYTHLLQNADEEMSAVENLNKMLKKSKASPEVKKRTVFYAPEFAIDVEKTIKSPINNSVRNPKLVTKYMQNKPSVSDVYKDNGIENIKKFANSVINEKIEYFTKKYGEFDENILKEYALLHLKRENEAYQVDYSTHKKVNPKVFSSPLEWDKLAKVQLYRILADLK